MDIVGHFESRSCVIEVDGSATLAQVKGKLLAELGVPCVRGVGVRMRGGGDIGNDDVRICDTEMDEGCAVELYYSGANITPGVITRLPTTYNLTLSPCNRYLAVSSDTNMSIVDTETHESLCSFLAEETSSPAFSPCSAWIASITDDTRCIEVHNVKTGALEHSFGGACDWGREATAWSTCGTKLLSCCSRGLQVWDIATGVVVHEWGDIVSSQLDSALMSIVSDDRVAVQRSTSNITVWDYTTGVEVLVIPCENVQYIAVTPNRCFIAACDKNSVHLWNSETGERVFEDVSQGECWNDVAVSNDVVAAYSPCNLCVWSISTGQRLWSRSLDIEEFSPNYGVAISSCGGVVMYGQMGVTIVDISDPC